MSLGCSSMVGFPSRRGGGQGSDEQEEYPVRLFRVSKQEHHELLPYSTPRTLSNFPFCIRTYCEAAVFHQALNSVLRIPSRYLHCVSSQGSLTHGRMRGNSSVMIEPHDGGTISCLVGSDRD